MPVEQKLRQNLLRRNEQLTEYTSLLGAYQHTSTRLKYLVSAIF